MSTLKAYKPGGMSLSDVFQTHTSPVSCCCKWECHGHDLAECFWPWCHPQPEWAMSEKLWFNLSVVKATLKSLLSICMESKPLIIPSSQPPFYHHHYYVCYTSPPLLKEFSSFEIWFDDFWAFQLVLVELYFWSWSFIKEEKICHIISGYQICFLTGLMSHSK